MAQAIVEELDKALWDSLGGRGTTISAQVLAVRNMKTGQLLVLTHEGFAPCGLKEKPSRCSLRSSLRDVKRNRPDATFSFKHLPDGRLGVACFTKEE